LSLWLVVNALQRFRPLECTFVPFATVARNGKDNGPEFPDPLS